MAHGEFTKTQKTWIKNGPIFDEFISIKGIAGGNNKFRVLERDTEGRIWNLDKRRGKKGFVLKVADTSLDGIETNDPPIHYALKVCLSEEYQDRQKLIMEFNRSKRLKSLNAVFSGIELAGDIENSFDIPSETKPELIGIVTDWVEGKTLKDYCENSPEVFNSNSVLSISIQLIKALKCLQDAGLKHDDLHTSNIMLYNSMSPDEEPRVVVIDTGNLKLLDQPTKAAHDDKTKILFIFSKLYDILITKPDELITYPYFFQTFQTLLQKLTSKDAEKHFPNGYADVLSDLERLKWQFQKQSAYLSR